MKVTQETILYVEDDPDDVFLVRESIRKLSNIPVETASDGKTALDLLHQRKKSMQLPSLIILDINLPKLDGNKLLLEIQKDEVLKQIPIVVFTTSISSYRQQNVDGMTVNAIAKPTDWDLYERIAKTILSFIY